MPPLDVEISVSPIIKEWIVSTYGSDTIQCQQDDFISSKIKYLLTLVPKDYKPKHVEKENRITIQLINFAIGNNSSNLYKKINEYHSFLCPTVERLIEKEFARNFKSTFHNFVFGYVVSTTNAVGTQKEGIETFCSVYGITMNKINYEMLKKSWDRSTEKRVLMLKFLNN